MDALFLTLWQLVADDPAHARLLVLVVLVAVAVAVWVRRLANGDGRGNGRTARQTEHHLDEIRHSLERIAIELRGHEAKDEAVLGRMADAAERSAEAYGRLSERFEQVCRRFDELMAQAHTRAVKTDLALDALMDRHQQLEERINTLQSMLSSMSSPGGRR